VFEFENLPVRKNWRYQRVIEEGWTTQWWKERWLCTNNSNMFEFGNL